MAFGARHGTVHSFGCNRFRATWPKIRLGSEILGASRICRRGRNRAVRHRACGWTRSIALISWNDGARQTCNIPFQLRAAIMLTSIIAATEAMNAASKNSVMRKSRSFESDDSMTTSASKKHNILKRTSGMASNHAFREYSSQYASITPGRLSQASALPNRPVRRSCAVFLSTSAKFACPPERSTSRLVCALQRPGSSRCATL
jgi:hypothetical protein